MISAQEYILSRLKSLKEKPGSLSFKTNTDLVDFLYKTLLSKKFRKYSVNPEYQKHIRSAIELNVKNKEPIKVTLVFGGYKLWRFEEAPEPDWAELFSMIYYAQWLKPVADHYASGVWFDFYSDDAIVKYINNIPEEDTKRYQETFQELVNFLKPHLPNNMEFTFHRVADQYSSEKEFLTDLELQKKKLLEKYKGKIPSLSDEQKKTVSLNVQLTPEQEKDSAWQEKVQLLHDAYTMVEKRRPYYRTLDKIMAITKKADNTIAIGTTKTSIAKFWIGVGALKKQDGGLIETVLTPNQLTTAEYTWEPVALQGLSRKNFQKVRIIN